MRVEKRILGGHEGLELVHVVDFNFGLTNPLLQGERSGQDRDLDLLQMSRLTVQRDALVEDDSVDQAAVTKGTCSVLGHADALVGERVPLSRSLHEEGGVHHQGSKFRSTGFGARPGHGGQRHVQPSCFIGGRSIHAAACCGRQRDVRSLTVPLHKGQRVEAAFEQAATLTHQFPREDEAPRDAIAAGVFLGFRH